MDPTSEELLNILLLTILNCHFFSDFIVETRNSVAATRRVREGLNSRLMQDGTHPRLINVLDDSSSSLSNDPRTAMCGSSSKQEYLYTND